MEGLRGSPDRPKIMNMNQNQYQEKIEKLLNGNRKKEISEWKKGSKARAEAFRRAFIKGLKAGDYFVCRHCYNLTYWSRKHNTNYSLNYWFRSKKAMEKVYQLEQELKRPEYAGKTTKKRRMLNQLYDQTIRELSKFDISRVFPERK